MPRKSRQFPRKVSAIKKTQSPDMLFIPRIGVASTQENQQQKQANKETNIAAGRKVYGSKLSTMRAMA